MKKIMYLGIAIEELRYFEVFDLQWPQMTLEVKILKKQMFVYTITLYMQKMACVSVFIKVWPQLTIFDLQWPLSFDFWWPPLTSEVKFT